MAQWKKIHFDLAHLEGGNLPNAIPRDAIASLVVNPKEAKELMTMVDKMKESICAEFAQTELSLTISIAKTNAAIQVIDKTSAQNLIQAMLGCYNGVYGWSKDMENLVETSTNLASVKSVAESQLLITTSQRSSVESRKFEIMHTVESVFRLAGMTVSHGDGYPGWKPNIQSPILAKATRVYHQLFDEEPRVRAIHAGLECGLLLAHYPWLDAISIGPTMKGVHSPKEQLNIASVAKTWQYLLALLSEQQG